MTEIRRYEPAREREILQRGRFAWESEETLVDERRRPRRRIRRFFMEHIVRNLFVLIVIVALVDAGFMRGLINFLNSVMPTVFRLFFRVASILGFYILIFWFLGRAKTYVIWPGSEAEGISFEDYRGQPELLEQARQIVTLLRGVRAFEEAGGEPLNGLLLEGPPGTGKTWLGKAISTEAGVPFFYIDGSSMTSMFIGIAPLKVMGLYRKARRAAKNYGAAIIFIDEIDAVGSRGGVARKREEFRDGAPFTRLPIFMGMGGANIGLLSTLLVELSGFSQEHGWWARKKKWWYRNILRKPFPRPPRHVLTIGATNRIHALDDALLRPGRLDKKIRVDVPDLEGRREILDYYLSKIAHDDTMDAMTLAVETPFYSPADLKYVLNEALRYALFDGRTAMNYRDFARAQPEHEMGLRKRITNLTYKTKRRLAAHEAAHAIAVRLYRPDWRISRITIIRQGEALGHVSYTPATENYEYISTEEALQNRLRIAVAGKAGEMEYGGEHEQTLGVGGDFRNIRFVLQRMAGAGMFGPLGIAEEPETVREVRQLMEETFLHALDEVRTDLRLHREMGEALIEELLEKEELLASDAEAFFDRYGLHTPKPEIGEALQEKPRQLEH